MPKAVLIMDMPEQVCQKCTLCYETENDDEYLCCATGKLVPDGAKPDWCHSRNCQRDQIIQIIVTMEGSMQAGMPA